jgi:hypothetical protein
MSIMACVEADPNSTSSAARPASKTCSAIFNVYSVYIQCVSSVYIQCVSSVYSVCIQCVFSVYSVCIQCIYSVY